jgi:diacylglycerol kinase (ATP)
VSRPEVALPAAIFLNEAAGSARSRRVRRTVELAQRALQADLHVVATRNQDELREWMDARMGPYRTVVVAGGDGSLGIALNAAAARDVALGYIPAGFGNATAHLLHLPRDPDALAAVLATGEARPVDLVQVDGRLALFAGVGWDAVVAGRYAQAGARRLRGWARAVVGSRAELMHRHRVHVEAEGRLVHAGPMQLLVVGTTPFYGRGMIVNPGARTDAGRLMLRVYPGPAHRLAAEAARWFLHVNPRARGVMATHASVATLDGRLLPLQADGDVIGARERWELVLAPAAARLIGRWQSEPPTATRPSER